MKRQPRSRLEYASLIGIPAAFAIVLAAQVLEGASARSLWQPTAALVVFGGTAVAVFVSFPAELLVRTLRALAAMFRLPSVNVDVTLERILAYAHTSRRQGLIALEPEIDR